MDEMPNHRTIIITGIIGIAAAILVRTVDTNLLNISGPLLGAKFMF